MSINCEQGWREISTIMDIWEAFEKDKLFAKINENNPYKVIHNDGYEFGTILEDGTYYGFSYLDGIEFVVIAD